MSLICILYNKHFNIIVLSVLRFTASDYPYAIFKRFYPWYLYLCTHTGVQYSFHIIPYSCRLPVPWQMPLIEQELLSTCVHPAFNRVRVVQSFIFFIVFYRSVFNMCPIPFGHCIVCPSIYNVWFSIWHLQTFLLWYQYKA